MAIERLGDMRLFVEAATLGSLSAAGRKLGLSPAAASARLIKLEATLQTRLFERTTRKLRVTEEGNVYLHYCHIALQALGDGEAALQDRENRVRGKVRISTTSDFGRNMLRQWLDEFNQLHPEVSFALNLSDSLSDLLDEEIDLAIRFAPPRDSNLVARHLAPNHRVLCASPNYLARHGEPATPDELLHHHFVLITTSAGPLNELNLVRGKQRWNYTVPVEQSWETNGGALCRDWILAGHGIAHKSIWHIAEDVHAGTLKILLPEWSTKEDSVHALFHRNRYMPPRVRAFLDFLIERFNVATKDLLPN